MRRWRRCGFPTEREDEFEATMELVRTCRFKNSFIFKYSPRPGTVAIERFADDVSEEVNRELVGKTVEVMVEGESKLVSRQAPALSKVELGWERRGRAPSEV